MPNTATNSPTEAEQLLICKYLDAIKTQVPIAHLIAGQRTVSLRPGLHLYFVGDGRLVPDEDCSILFKAAAALALQERCLLSVFVDEDIAERTQLDLGFLEATAAN